MKPCLLLASPQQNKRTMSDKENLGTQPHRGTCIYIAPDPLFALFCPLPKKWILVCKIKNRKSLVEQVLSFLGEGPPILFGRLGYRFLFPSCAFSSWVANWGVFLDVAFCCFLFFNMDGAFSWPRRIALPCPLVTNH